MSLKSAEDHSELNQIEYRYYPWLLKRVEQCIELLKKDHYLLQNTKCIIKTKKGLLINSLKRDFNKLEQK
jgi:hypothetical protein